MLKIVMAQPSADDRETGKRSMFWHMVHGTISDLVGNTLAVTEWFRFTDSNGKQVLINAKYIAWIEEVNERQQVTQPS